MTEKVKREFLSRGKREYDEAWVTGYLVFEDNEQKPIIISILTFDDYEDDEVDEQNIRDFYYYYVIPETIGRCAGITDTNGRDVFDGDIVKIDGDDAVYMVVFVDGVYRLCDNKRQYSFSVHNYVNCMTVVGNIFDNPELLERDD